MFTTKMKQDLIEKIQSLSDETVLEEVYRILEVGLHENETITLTNEQKNLIDLGLKDIAEGNFLTNEQANNEIEEWLKK